MNRTALIKAPVALAVALAYASAHGGTFTQFGGRPTDQVVYPGGYNGTGGELGINVCLDPAQLPAGGGAQAEQAIRNVIAEFNRMQGTAGNVSSNPSPGDDFEGVLLHEVGHCVGMGHTVFGPSEVGSGSASLYFPNATTGADASRNTDAGADGIRGTRDDVRGDDINLNWFQIGVNDPWAPLAATIDRVTFSQDLADLPAGYNFVEVASSFTPCSSTADSSLLFGEAATQNTMFPVICGNNLLRRLAPDDVALLRVARSGLDGVQGSADDFTTALAYAGQTSSCDIVIKFNESTGYANCSVSASVSGSRVSITTGTINMNSNVDWHFNQGDTTGDAVGPTVSASSPASGSTTSLGGGNIDDRVNGAIDFTLSGGSGSGTTAFSCSVASGTVVIDSGTPQTLSVGGTVSPVAVSFTLASSSQTGQVDCTATPDSGTAANFTYTFTADAGAAAGAAPCDGDCVFRSGFEPGEG